MVRRRRQKSPLLGRIIAISVILHVILLPVLGYFGAFKKIGQSLGMTQVIVVPPPVAEKTPPAAKKTPKVAAKSEPKGKSAASHAKAAPRPALNQPSVVASRGTGPESDAGTAVNPNGTGTAGAVPTPVLNGNGKGDGNGAGSTKPAETPANPPPPVETTPKPALTPTPKVEPKPKVPVFAEAEVVEQPRPEIPDELRNDVLNASVVAEFVVRADGSISDVKITRSAGIDQLDRVALETLKKWKFRPATRDGQPTEGRVRLHIDFEVR